MRNNGSIFIMLEDNRTCLGFQPKQILLKGLLLEQVKDLYKKYNRRIISNTIAIVQEDTKKYYKVLLDEKGNTFLDEIKESLFELTIKNSIYGTYIKAYIKAPSKLYAEWFYFAQNKHLFNKKSIIQARYVKEE